MSYILDALKKSEQDRKKGRVPGLGTIQGLPGGRLEDNWPIRYYFLGTLVLIVATAIITWLFFQEPHPSPTKTTTAATPPQTAAPVAAPATKATSPEKLPGRAEGDRHPEQSAPAKLAAPHRPRTLEPTATAIHNISPPAGTAPLRPAKPAPKTAVPTKAPAAETAPAAPPAPPQPSPTPEKAESTPPPSPPPSEESEVVIKPEDMPIIPLAELPDELKSVMPEVKIGIHFFSDDHASRRAGVNGRLLHEGQQVDKDLILKEITKDGAILAFRGRRFSLPVFPR